MNEFKGTPGPWVVDIRGGCVAVYPDGEQWETPGCHRSDERNIAYSDKGAAYDERVGHWSMDKKTVHDYTLIAAAPELLDALQWALPMAILAMEQHRMERVKNGHVDISGTYKNGESWVGIYQDEVDKIEFARAAIAKSLGESQ